MENGSGGFLSNMQFSGGNIGLQCGNQQFTSRALTFTNMKYAIWMSWDWGWLCKSTIHTYINILPNEHP